MIEIIISENAGDYEVIVMDDGIKVPVPGRYWEDSFRALVAAKELKQYMTYCFPDKEVKVARRNIY